MATTPFSVARREDSYLYSHDISACDGSDSESEESIDEPQFRNIFVRDASNAIVASVIQRGYIKISTFYRWLDMILIAKEMWFLAPENSISTSVTVLSRSDDRVLPLGSYVMANGGGLPVYVQPVSVPRIRRIFSRGERTPPTAADAAFTELVTERDGLCCMTETLYHRQDGEQYNKFLPATHIFPLAYMDKWIHSELSSKIVDDGTEEDKINTLLSPQNGITLDLSAQALFDSYAIAVDVDDDYRLVELSNSTYLNLEKTPKLVRNTEVTFKSQPSTELLKAHFIQALIQNVLGDGLTSSQDKNHRNWLRERDSIYFGEKVDLSRKIWTSDVGKDILERYLLMQLYGCLPQVEGENTSGRWSTTRLNIFKALNTETPEHQDWPEQFDLPSEVKVYVTESNPVGYPFEPTWYKFLHEEGKDPGRYFATPPIVDPEWKFHDAEYQAALQDFNKRVLLKVDQYAADMAKLYDPAGYPVPAQSIESEKSQFISQC